MAAPEPVIKLLKDVSRSFYLTLRVLPGAIRPQIGLAYLLARATDTIADTEIVPVLERLRALEQLRESILGQSNARLDFSRFVDVAGAPNRAESSQAERDLLRRIEEALAVLSTYQPDDQHLIREVISTITSGQELDLHRFGGTMMLPDDGNPNSPSSGFGPAIPALQTDAELDDYTYRVAGCVGEFWTRICRAHVFRQSPWNESYLLSRAVRFGKGLQLVNILRDLPVDLRKGRCYVPLESLKPLGLLPADLLIARTEPTFRPLFQELLARAEAHLAAGWEYTLALPREGARVRLACAWPILIGVRTLRRLRNFNMLDGENRIKISRAEVRIIMARSVFLYPFPSLWRRLFAGASRPTDSASLAPRV